MKCLFQNSQTNNQIKKIISTSDNIYLAVAYWGKGSSDYIKNQGDKEIKIICNLESGATNPYEIIKIGKAIGFRKIRSIKNLHSKVYLGDKQMVLGSSNFSANGLSLEGAETNNLIEANVLIENRSVIKETKVWFSSLWDIAKKVDENYCKKYIPQWASRKKRKAESNFFRAYEMGMYAVYKIYLIVDTEEFSKEEEIIGNREAKNITKNDIYYAGKKLSYWRYFPNVPREAFIISYFYAKNRLSYQGIYKTLAEKYDRKDFQFCYLTNEHPLQKSHIKQIREIVKSHMKIPDDGFTISLSKLYKKYQQIAVFKPSGPTRRIA